MCLHVSGIRGTYFGGQTAGKSDKGRSRRTLRSAATSMLTRLISVVTSHLASYHFDQMTNFVRIFSGTRCSYKCAEGAGGADSDSYGSFHIQMFLFCVFHVIARSKVHQGTES